MSLGWQEELRQRLVDRNQREAAYTNIIEQCMSVPWESGLAAPDGYFQIVG